MGLIDSLSYAVRALGWKIRTGRFEEALAEIEIFDSLPPNLRRQLARRGTLLVSPANTVITEPGIGDHSLYVVATGKVRISTPSHPDERERRGRVVGELAVFGNFESAIGHPDPILAVTETGSEILVLDLSRLVGPLGQESELVRALNESYLRTVLTAYLRKLDYFSHLSANELESLAQRFAWGHFPAGRFVFRQGDYGVDLHYIRRGRALLDVVSYDRRQGRPRTRYHELDESDHFGELALLGQTARPATVQAITALSTLTIQREKLLDFYAQFPDSRLPIEVAMTKYVASRAWLEKQHLPTARRAEVRRLVRGTKATSVNWLKRSDQHPV